MKKALSVLLAIVMVFTLFACSNSNSGTSSSPSPAASPSASPASAAPDTSAPPASESPSAAVDPSVNADEIGFFNSGVDPKSRDTYHIVWAYTYSLMLFEKMGQVFKDYQDKLNVEVTPMTAENDMDKYLINIETFAEQGADGFLIVLDPATKFRIIEVLEETGCPYIALFNSARNEAGNSLVPTVGTDQKNAGATTMQWLADNYKTYWGDIDTSKLGLMAFTLSVSPDLNDRAVITEEVFANLFPKNKDLIFRADAVTGTGAASDIAYNMASTIFSGQPNVDYWFVTCTLEMYGQGVARAVEALGMEDKVLIVDIGSDILCSEWDTGYDGSWKSCLGMSNYLYAAPAICGLVSILDGKSTPESLWPSFKKPGDVAAFYTTTYEMLLKDTYKDYFNGIAEQAGMALPYK